MIFFNQISFQHSQHPTLSTESIAESSYKTLSGSRGILGDFNHYVPSVAASPGFSLHHTESNVQDHSSLPRLVQGQMHLLKKFLQVHTFFPRIDERPVLSGNRRRMSHLWSCSHRRPAVEVEQSDLVAGGNATGSVGALTIRSLLSAL